MEVIQLVRTAVQQIVAFPMPQITGLSWGCSHGADCGLVPQIMDEITESSAGTLTPMILRMSPQWPRVLGRRGLEGAGVARSFAPG